MPEGSNTPTRLNLLLFAFVQTTEVFYGSFTKKSPVGLPNRLICQGKDGEKIYLNIQSEGVLDHLPNRQTRTGPWTMDSSMDRSMAWDGQKDISIMSPFFLLFSHLYISST